MRLAFYSIVFLLASRVWHCSGASMRVLNGGLSEKDWKDELQHLRGKGGSSDATNQRTNNHQARNLEDEFEGLDCNAAYNWRENEATGELIESYPRGCACKYFGVTTFSASTADLSETEGITGLSKKSKKFSKKQADKVDDVFMTSTRFVNMKTGKEAYREAKLGYLIEDVTDNIEDGTRTITDVGEQLLYFWYHGDISSADRDDIPKQGPFIMLLESGKTVSLGKNCTVDEKWYWDCAYSEFISVEGKVVMFCDKLE